MAMRRRISDLLRPPAGAVDLSEIDARSTPGCSGGTKVVKCFLHISSAERRARLPALG